MDKFFNLAVWVLIVSLLSGCFFTMLAQSIHAGSSVTSEGLRQSGYVILSGLLFLIAFVTCCLIVFAYIINFFKRKEE
ncbi:hypothetical protein DSL64_25080 [Dyadobacter luteus]|jgi:uncharacterized membrane protein|uniref:Uncharacterized protein n=1 Tax=Dyadobacter luteus TaxID=2259619 RepID=A0A3D8Y477_9BACT|nr:hypothetical protein DSL64_25080 [Dyadobacter luteus]